MRRRVFLGVAGAAAAAPDAARIRIAFLGVSHSHASDKVKICRQPADWELVGIWERDPKVAATYGSQGVKLMSKDAILADASIPVVAVESEVKPHAELALQALAAGKHVHLEKPPSDNMADLRRLVALAREKKRLLQVGYMWRQHPGMNAILEAGRKGWLGDIYLVRGMMNTLIGADRRPEWALFPGGQMFEQGGHLIDPMVRLMGRPSKVSHFLRHHGKFSDDLLDNTVAVLEYPGAMGVITSAVLQSNANAHRMFEVQGSNGTALLRPIEPPRLEIDLAKAAGPYKAGKQEVPLPAYQRYVGDFLELARCVRTSEPLAVSLEQELDVQEALLRASGMFQ